MHATRLDRYMGAMFAAFICVALVAGCSGTTPDSVPTGAAVPSATGPASPTTDNDHQTVEPTDGINPAVQASAPTIAMLTDVYPDDFAYSHEVGKSVAVAFAAAAPVDARTALESLGLEIRAVENTGFSAVEVETAVLALADVVSHEAGPGIEFEVSPEPHRETFTVRIFGGGEEQSESELRAIEDALAATGLPSLTNPTLSGFAIEVSALPDSTLGSR